MYGIFWRDGPRLPSILLFGVVFLSLAGCMYLIFKTLEVEEREREQVTLTNKVLAALRDSSRAVIDAETGQRGYLITSDPDYLAPYHRGMREWPLAQERLENSLRDVATAEQSRLVGRMRVLAERKFAELEDTVEQVEAGDVAGARARVLTDEGRSAMVEFRRIVTRLETLEQSILDDARAQANLQEERLFPLLLALVLVMLIALALGVWLMFRVARAEALAASADQIARQRDRADLVSRELNHRVQNLFAVVQAIVQMTLRSESDMREAGRKITERIQALATAHRVTQGQLETPLADLRDIVETSVAPYVGEDRAPVIQGPPVTIVADKVTPIGLILHELVTNCVKYGAWSDRAGEVEVRWNGGPSEGGPVELEWIERIPGGVAAPTGSGFGTRMITASVHQLGATLDREFSKEGLRVRLRFDAA